MKPISFKETNAVSDNSPGTPPTPYCKASSPDYRSNTIITKWKLSDEELSRINQTGELWIVVWHPDISLCPTVHNPFTELNFKPKD